MASRPARLIVLPCMTILGDYEDDMAGRGLGRQTVEKRMNFARARLREWRTLDVPPAKVAAWLAGYTGWSRYTYFNHLRDLFAWAVRAELVGASPMDGMRRPPLPRPKARPLSPIEVQRVLAPAAGRQRAWLLLAYLAGLRAHEIAKIRGEDVNADAIYINGKGGVIATVPTHPDLWALAQEFPRAGHWFPSPYADRAHISVQVVSSATARHFRACGIPSGSIHRLRASYGTALLRSGANVRVVQTLLRHASLQTTEHYLGVDEDERTAAIGRLFSVAS